MTEKKKKPKSGRDEKGRFVDGNKFATRSKHNGRKRTCSPTDEDFHKLGKELIEWAKVDDEENPRLQFPEFYSLVKHILREDWKSIIQAPVFLPYYEQAKALLSKRCVNGMMEKSFGHRFLRLYTPEIVESENAELKYKSDLAVKEAQEQAKTLAELAKASENGELSQK